MNRTGSSINRKEDRKMAINSLSSASYGISGLVSGINTQEYVEKMLSGTQSKINSSMQKKTVLQYKQGLYRDVASQLTLLQDSYMSFASKTNLWSTGFFNTMNTSIKPPTGTSAAFSVSAASGARPGNVVMQSIEQLATARTSRTQTNASGAVSGTMDKKVANELLSKYTGPDATMNIKIGETTISIKDAPLHFAGMSQSEVAEELNNIFAKHDNIAEARFVNNKLEITAKNEEDFITFSSANKDKGLPLSMFGSGITTIGDKGVFSAAIDTSNYQPSMEINLDGRQKTINLDLQALNDYAKSGDGSPEEEAALKRLTEGLNSELKRAFGSSVSADLKDNGKGGFDISFAAGNNSQKFDIKGNYVTMGMFGMKSGISNKLSTDMKIKDLNFATDLQGSQQTFSINGVEFSYSSDATLSSIINDINSSKAGVKVSYMESEDRFVIQSSETGAGGAEFNIKQTSGNLMTVLFGSAEGTEATGAGINVELKGTKALENKNVANGGTFTFNIGGRDVTYKINRKEGDKAFTVKSFVEELNKRLKSQGTMANGDQAVEVKINKDGTLSMISNHPDLEVKINPYDKTNNTNLLGFEAGASTRAHSGKTTLEQAGINFGDSDKIVMNVGGTDIEVTKDDLLGNGLFENMSEVTMDRFVEVMNAKLDEHYGPTILESDKARVTFDEKTAAFKISAGKDGDGDPIAFSVRVEANDPESKDLENLFGQEKLSVGGGELMYDTGEVDEEGNAIMASVFKTTDEGQNAIFTLNGETMQRASNTFTVDGLTYTLHSTTFKDQEAQSGEHVGPSSIAVTRDIDQIVDGITEFIEMYNETVNMLTGLIRADTTYKDYPPLTAEQKLQMSESEVKAWEEKAKEGLLRGDSTIERILADMRSAMFYKPEGSAIALYDLGISTSFYAKEGNFEIGNPTDLRALIEKDPEAVAELFSGTGGIMDKLNATINDATKSSGTKNSLVALAGTNSFDTDSSIYKQIREIDEQLSTLENRYWNEYNRYWKQFNAMEQMVAQMNNQSSWLASNM